MQTTVNNEKKAITNASKLPSLTLADFDRVSGLVYELTGIKMPRVKRTLLSGRLIKRMKALNMENLHDYCEYLFSNEGNMQEMGYMVDVVTTNKTDFFREIHHFHYLRSQLLPELSKQLRVGSPLKVWSSACSSGEEVYTLAMVIDEFAKKANNFSYQILGTDISKTVLQKAQLAVYMRDRIADIPTEYRHAYLLKSKSKDNPTVRIAPELRSKVVFRYFNLMNTSYDSLQMGQFDIIFCRNVLIYFDRPTQERVVTKLVQQLKPGGYFFLGHSESINQMNLPLVQVHPTVFRKIIG